MRRKHRGEPATTFAPAGMPRSHRIGISVVAALLLALVGILVVSPSSPPQALTVSAPSTTSGPTTSLTGGGGGRTTGTTTTTTATGPSPAGVATAWTSSSVVPGSAAESCAVTYGCVATPTTNVVHSLRSALPSELDAVTAEVLPPPGQRIDSVAIARSDPTWGLLHLPVGGGAPQDYVLIELIKGKWHPADSGYPTLKCDQTIPPGVLADLGAVATACP